MWIAENKQIAIIYDLTNPKKNPNIESNVPSPVYLNALLIPLLMSNTRNIVITKIRRPKTISKIYSLSIISYT